MGLPSLGSSQLNLCARAISQACPSLVPLGWCLNTHLHLLEGGSRTLRPKDEMCLFEGEEGTCLGRDYRFSKEAEGILGLTSLRLCSDGITDTENDGKEMH